MLMAFSRTFGRWSWIAEPSPQDRESVQQLLDCSKDLRQGLYELASMVVPEASGEGRDKHCSTIIGRAYTTLMHVLTSSPP